MNIHDIHSIHSFHSTPQTSAVATFLCGFDRLARVCVLIMVTDADLSSNLMIKCFFIRKERVMNYFRIVKYFLLEQQLLKNYQLP